MLSRIVFFIIISNFVVREKDRKKCLKETRAARAWKSHCHVVAADFNYPACFACGSVRGPSGSDSSGGPGGLDRSSCSCISTFVDGFTCCYVFVIVVYQM